jgi:uncharacterized RDD family membrane protein YckC
MTPTSPHGDDFDPYAPPRADVNTGAGSDASAIASRGARFGGALLDFIYVWLCSLPSTAVLRSAVLTQETGFGRLRALLFALGLVVLLMIAGQTIQWYLIVTSGQSIGKKLVGTRIVRIDGEPLTFGSVIVLRSWLPALLSSLHVLGLGFFIVDACFIFADDRRCLHDTCAGTKGVLADAVPA